MLVERERFHVRLAANAKPGRYQFMCLIHGGRMVGTLTVVDATVPVPPASEVEQKGRQEVQALAAVVAGGRQTATGPRHIVAGVILPNLANAYLAEFVPSQLSISVGETVRFDAVATHTVSFNAADDDVGLLRRGPDGGAILNTRAVEPVDSPSPPPHYRVFHTSQTGGVSLDGGSFDGRGFKSSGLLSVRPPGAVSYNVAFTRPGSYEVRCLVHRDMKAQITVR